MCMLIVNNSTWSLLQCRKHIFNQVQHYIHFNLSLSLLLGLIVFVSGIQTAVNSDVSFVWLLVCSIMYMHIL